MGPVVELKNVGHAFGEGTRLFRGITLTLLPERVYALVGPSGSGKSTLLSIIAGWQTPSEGEVVRRDIGKISWVFQNPIGVARRTALDHVMLPYLGQGYATGDAERMAREQLERFGLADSAGKRFGELSGGEAQRLMLARGVATNADLLLVDEPTAQLDMRTADAVDQYLGALSRSGMIVVVATHDHRTRDAASDVIDLEHYQ
ncbi:ABC transporter ATP-binding protein [Bifidobacterium amazonense]|uniref:ABC transporter ATP-binding protein n=1 Tax=Bifidobacterium amazonense TaxID=2809027 RepID=A0ABS9VRQ9_9BIFI|nr:ABC transporter ATP-binding protein [Bifidobacterium amazonense]MCH9274794.1 ABC transporter ATP-binding protein [Bifidobacterium amazonense]